MSVYWCNYKITEYRFHLAEKCCFVGHGGHVVIRDHHDQNRQIGVRINVSFDFVTSAKGAWKISDKKVKVAN